MLWENKNRCRYPGNNENLVRCLYHTTSNNQCCYWVDCLCAPNTMGFIQFRTPLTHSLTIITDVNQFPGARRETKIVLVDTAICLTNTIEITAISMHGYPWYLYINECMKICMYIEQLSVLAYLCVWVTQTTMYLLFSPELVHQGYSLTGIYQHE